MDVEKGSIYKLLNGQNQYIVPVYQRKYSWRKEEQCARLWRDIVAMEKSKKLHFVGSIVSVAEKVSLMGVHKSLIIDGQQRMTTLSLLMIALRDYLLDSNIPDKITNESLKNTGYTGDDAYKLLLTDEDRDVMISLIEHRPIATEEQDSRIYQNYLYFKDRVLSGELTPDQIYESISRLTIVAIVLDRDQGDDPQLIFESLNSTGLDLSKSDLIRNYLLMGLNQAEQDKIYHNYWHPFETQFVDKEDEERSDRMDRFFRDYLTMKKGSFVKFDNIYEVFKEYAAQKTDFDTIEELAEDIRTFGDLYTNIVSEQKQLPVEQEILKPIWAEIRSLRMEVTYPFLMRVYNDCIVGRISIAELADIARLTIAYIVRRAVCEIPTNSLNKTFATLKNSINYDDYFTSVKAAFYFLDSYKCFPDDSKFTFDLCSRNMYTMRICKYILTKLENFQNKEPIQSANYTIEHILPQNKNMRLEWQKALGENYAEIHAKYVDTLGNLTLTCYNSEMSDKSFDDKKKVYKESAMHTLNKYVTEQDTWNEDRILARVSILAKEACKVWAAPILAAEEIEKYSPKEEQTTTQQVYDISVYEFNANTRMLYDRLLEAVMEVEPNTRVEYKKLYIAHKLHTNFLDVVVQNKRLRLAVNLDFEDVFDPKSICRDVSGLGRWGNGDVEIAYESPEQVPDILDIVKQAIAKQK
jgi:uncharacterized protein with ParB-like and HNH nuclease domain/predicted transport protein